MPYAAAMAPSSSPPPRANYLALTRSWTYSSILALPILVAYELGVRVVDSALRTPIRNGADAMLQSLASIFGNVGPILVPTAVAATLLVLCFRERARGLVIQRGAVVGMIVEALAYAAIFGGVVGRLTALLLPHALAALGTGIGGLPVAAQVVLSLGAGFYEEVLFRGLVLGGLRFVLGLVIARPRLRDGAAVLLAALLFSAYHHVGPYGDPFSLQVFMFRFVAGLILSGLLVLRGFGITVATHAFYDVLYSLGLAF